MKPEVTPLRVTLVDALGALVPGLFWLILLSTLLRVLGEPAKFVTPFGTAVALLDAATARGTTFTLFLVLCALVGGYGAKPLTNAAAESLLRRFTGTFPYNAEHLHKPYFKRLASLVLSITDAATLDDLKGFQAQPFSTCKRYLKLQSAALWEEAERAEAETRMLSSMFLASLAALAMVAASALVSSQWPAEATQAAVVSSILVVVLAMAFRRRRRTEVALVYLNTLVALDHAKRRLEGPGLDGARQAPNLSPAAAIERESRNAMQPKITLITLGVDDLPRAVAFYRDGLKLATKGIVGTEFENGAVAFFNLQSGLKLALWPRRSLAADSGLQEGPARSAVEFSLAHNVGSREEVDAVFKQATAAGARVVKAPAPTFYGGYAGYFQDPDGHLWEVAFNPGFESLG